MAKVKIPKRVGGVKIPKKVRRKARKALEVAESPALRELAAAALGAAAHRRASAAAAGGAGERGRSRNPASEIDAAQLAETVCAAALDGVSRFLQGLEEGLRAASAAADGAEAGAPPAPPRPPKRAAPPKRPRTPRARPGRA